MAAAQIFPAFTPLAPIVAAGGALVLAHCTPPTARPQAAVTMFGTVIATALTVLLLAGGFSGNALIALTLALLAAFAIASPLLDRTRFAGMIFAASAGGVATVIAVMDFGAHLLPMAPQPAWLHAALITASVTGLAGSTLLPIHPARITVEGAARMYPSPRGAALLGWVAIATVFSGLLVLLEPSGLILASVPVAALTAAFVALAGTRYSRVMDGLQKTGEALVAGVLVSALTPATPMMAIGMGAVAGLLVVRAESAMLSLRIDDPAHLGGTVCAPAMLGLLLPGLMSVHLLAPALVWLGAAIACGLVLSLFLWPFSMLLFGLALPERLLKGS